MSNSSSSSDPFAGLVGAGGLGSTDPKSVDRNFKMRHSSVRTLGTNVASYGQDLTHLSEKTRAIDMHTLTFGVFGGGLNVTHRSARDAAADALKQGREVLESWKQALKTAADNTETAEEASKAAKKGSQNSSFKTPKFNNTGFGDPSKLGKMPSNAGLGNLGKNGIDPDDFKVDKPSPDDLKQPDIPQPDVKQPEQPDIPQPNVDQPDLQQPNLEQPNLQQPNLQQPDLQQPDLTTPNLNQPKTDLQSVDPHLPTSTAPQIRTPDISQIDPRAAIPRTTVSYPESNVGGPAAGTAGVGAPGSIARALNTGTPIYPPGGMGGAAGSKDDKDRERGPHVGEEEGVWGADEDATPAVLGKEV
ncbi:hypothetical protein [Nonomuraea helvata]|uniref:Uncharacterized protein n=1 Tax=Nonomuraea helvata TaxID=37484 RepID=A0ABV5RVH3_9ACTN